MFRLFNLFIVCFLFLFILKKILNFIECRHRFNEYYSWINSLIDVEKLDSLCIHRSRNLIELMCLSEALKLNVTLDKVRSNNLVV
jgi:hypothetical protein